MALLYGEGHFVGMVWVRIQLRWHFSVFKSERVVTKPDLNLTGVLFLTSKSQSHMKFTAWKATHFCVVFNCFGVNFKPQHLKGTYVIISYHVLSSSCDETFLS